MGGGHFAQRSGRRAAVGGHFAGVRGEGEKLGKHSHRVKNILTGSGRQIAFGIPGSIPKLLHQTTRFRGLKCGLEYVYAMLSLGLTNIGIK